jgi:hypothetical protein
MPKLVILPDPKRFRCLDVPQRAIILIQLVLAKRKH